MGHSALREAYESLRVERDAIIQEGSEEERKCGFWHEGVGYCRTVIRDGLTKGLRDWVIAFGVLLLIVTLYRLPSLLGALYTRSSNKRTLSQAWFIMLLRQELFTILRHMSLLSQTILASLVVFVTLVRAT